MKDTADIVDRLRDRAAANKYNARRRAELIEAAETIENLRARLEEEYIKRAMDA